MAKKSVKITKDSRISAEIKRLGQFYKNMDEVKKGIAQGLIERAAFMRIECEDLELFLLKNGWTELFTQSEKTEPYARYRPEAQAYQTLNGNYQKIIKQLDSMLPKVEAVPESDGFDEFLSRRDEM